MTAQSIIFGDEIQSAELVQSFGLGTWRLGKKQRITDETVRATVHKSRVRGTEGKMEKAIKRIIRSSLKIGEKCDYARPATARYRKCRRLTRNSMH